MKRLIVSAVGIVLALGSWVLLRHLCAGFEAPDRKAHAYLEQRQTTSAAVAGAYSSASLEDTEYTSLRATAVAELERLRQLANDRVALGYIADSQEELALADQCHKDRTNLPAFNLCKDQLTATIGGYGH